jgi:hypothetical protein
MPIAGLAAMATAASIPAVDARSGGIVRAHRAVVTAWSFCHFFDIVSLLKG